MSKKNHPYNEHVTEAFSGHAKAKTYPNWEHQYPGVCHANIPTCDIITTGVVSFREVKKRRRVLTAVDSSDATREIHPSILEWKRRFEENLARIRRDMVLGSQGTKN